MINSKEYLRLLTTFRQDLHRIPELGFDLYETSIYVKDKLESFGYTPELVAETGLVAIKPGKSNEAIAFRADMDGLSVLEKTDVSFLSENLGKMHACGHDGHMAILLGLAHVVAKLNLNKTIVFIFQPAEEGPGGASKIIEEGIFSKYNIKRIFGLHLYPNLEEGIIGLVDGAMMAKSGEFKVIINGKSSHGAMPHLGSDAILIACQLINNYQPIISRNLDPLDSGVLTIGMIHGGEAKNIIASQVTIEGTIRAFDEKNYQIIKDRMKQINDGFAIINQVKIDMEVIDSYPPVVNDKTLYQDVLKILSTNEYEIIKPMMTAEDFSYYQIHVPGFFFMLGTKNQKLGFIHPLHSCYFNFDESVLVKGLELYIRLCLYYQVFTLNETKRSNSV